MTIILKRPAWHWRLRRWLGFASARRRFSRGTLYIPNTLSFIHPENDAFLNELIDIMTRPVGPPSRWWRIRRWLGFDSTRRLGSTPHTRSIVPIILRGPAPLAAP